WHMVAKLLLAVQECHAAADAAHAAALAEAYDDIRAGLGFMKTPEVFGAIPTDPYSHSPRHLGAQQPGMTGQVKEEVLTRLGELGVTVQAACLQLRPRLLHEAEFDPAPEPFVHLDLAGQPQALPLPPDALAFTVCQVPVCYRLGDQATLTVRYADGSSQTLQGDTLSAKDSAHVFARDGAVCGIVVQVPRGTLRP
ncbi:MAG: hypothetical protein KC613_11300, partial [Myxococcales bacterium]|nr:hypothetical protein [Myxococcales bacterium]